ncbi:MAG: hypothetical protein WBB27_12445 [Maribacter sp.]
MFYKINNPILALLVFFQILSCNTNSPKGVELELNEYLSKEFNLSLTEGNKYVFIYLDGCSSCIDLYRQFIANHENAINVYIFLITKSEKKANIVIGNSIKAKVYIDKKATALINYDLVKDAPRVYYNSPKAFEEFEISIDKITSIFL